MMPQPASTGEPEFAAFIAMDWADREHAWAMQVAGQTKRETGTLAHTPEAIEVWASQLAIRFQGRPVAVALEQSRGALLYALQRFPQLVLFVVHPCTSSDYRKAMFPSGHKDDPVDADLLLDLLTLHRDRLRVLQADAEDTRKLQLLVENRRQLVDRRTAESNRIGNQLKLFFPQVLNWFDELTAPIVGAFLQRWPTLPHLQQEDPATLRSFFHQHGSRSARRIEERLEQIRQAVPITRDSAIIEPAVLMIRTLLGVIAALHQGIQELEKSIEKTAAAHPDYLVFSSFPAAGPAMAPRLLAAFGSRRDRYRNVGELLSFSGIAPVMQASGRQCWIHFRWACPKFLRQTFHEYAGLSIQQCAWARAFYDRQRAKGKAHHAAVRSLAFKWIRILYRCWQSNTPYQDEIYATARQSRVTPLTRPKATATNLPHSTREKPKDKRLKTAGEILKSLMAEA